jgi:RNA polymerase sigma-70 factor (ECF subfamily)
MVYLFGPTVYQQCRSAGLQAADSSDVVQDVFRAVATRIRSFSRGRPNGTFRGWLWTITRNKIADHCHCLHKHPEAQGGTDAQIRLANLAVPESTDSDEQPGSQKTTSLYQRALQLLQSDFEGQTWKAFWRVSVDGCTPAEVADELGMSVNAVYIAKTRVLRRLREELGDLLD